MSSLQITKRERLQIVAVREVFSPWGLATAVEMGGKHLILKVWARDGVIYRMPIACTPRNEGDAIGYTRQRARRLLRLINAREGY